MSPAFPGTDSVIQVRGCELMLCNEYLFESTADDAIFSLSLSVFTTAPQFSAGRQLGDLMDSLFDGARTVPEGLITASDIVPTAQKFQLLDSALNY